MSKFQTYIKELTIQANILEQEVIVDAAELKKMVEAGAIVAKALEQKKERLNHIRHAVSNIETALEIENEVDKVAVDPWGELD